MTTRLDVRSALARSGGSTTGPLGAADRYGALLLLLVFTYLLSAFTSGPVINVFQVLLFLAVVLIALRNGQLQRRTVRIAAICLLTGSVLAAVILAADSNGPGAGVGNIWTALILLLSAVLIVRRVLARAEITLQSIYGAVSAYLILGLMFAAIYAAMFRFGGNHFFANGQPGDTRTFQYFSFVTLTTTGYGDFVAAGSGGRAFAVIEAITGQIFLATLVARLVAGFRGTQRGEARRARGRPAGAKRASVRRASAPAMVRLRPPGTTRPRPSTAGRAVGPGRAGPGRPPGGPATRQDTRPG
jgi:hypothetical protein